MSARKKSSIDRADQTPEEQAAERRQHLAARALKRVTASKLDLAFECLHWTIRDDLPDDKSGRAAATRGTPFHDGAATGVPGALDDDHEAWLADQLFATWLEKGRQYLPSTYREEVAYCLSPGGEVTRIGENLCRDYGLHVGICGTIDVDGHEAPESEVADYKTGKRLKPAKEAWQLRFGCVVTGARKRSFHYLDERGEVTPDSYECTAAEREDDRARLVVLMGDIVSGRTAPKPGEHCTSLYCPARKVCEAHQDHQKQKEKPMGRMSLQNVTKGKIVGPLSLCLYGPEGVGKSSFAMNAPKPIFLDVENGTQELDIERFPVVPSNWIEVLEAFDELTKGTHDYQTFVLDTADALEALIFAEVCRRGGKVSISDFGYGKGHDQALDYWRKVVENVEALKSKGMHVVILAHAHVKTFQNPAGDDYDRFRLKLHEKASSLLKERLGAVLFTNYVTYTREKEGKIIASGDGSRIVYTEHRPAWDAKNRYGLPFELPLNWGEFERAARRGTPVDIDAAVAAIKGLAESADEKLRENVNAALARCGDDPRKLASLLDWLKGKLHAAASSKSSTEAA